MGKAKKMKVLRRIIRESSNASENALSYSDTNVRVTSYVGGKDTEPGTVKPITTSTLVVNKNTERGLYKITKKEVLKNKDLMRAKL